ncbi:N-acetylmuramoyl-L-alanine amidase family protein [Clostridium beijerinckii]|jgi:FOG: Glucan-binding domain (YG repeat)|uniref:Cadherin-like beta sandwich domain-containing protein n=2 Tax=Clostridium beijerinckii TaxID=1520 RepID=A0AAE2RRZ2_CLOBE|nr:cadherin-like beta sandwich domain-containing protein [Clostridium beijerinckii]ABR36869.1 putative cell wall binding repeat-containing protein [Clostridium beijerinckii NCIMB 8052]AIU03455.1 cell wall binding repeat-containing protein [Clostridium beijerinckii ATCC 35702]MBF7808484.1 cadherin-like beta sandwich domain-containing protein [Clostridium beijerinckii]NRT22054.1 glucan-binding YG repeat protein [Clostridium beijerinckii]NRT65438.1 glucan-binding YG repeat protein [Clostridium be
MNKNIKRVIAIVLAIGIISAATPNSKINLLTTRAYASTTNDESTLDSLSLDDSDGNNVKLYDDNDYKNRVKENDVHEDETYYAKTSSKTVSVDISGPDDNFVRVFRDSSDSTKGKEVGDDIQLTDKSVVTDLIIKVYGKDLDGETVRNNEHDDDEYDLLNTYEVKVRHVDEDDSDKTDFDDIYLERLSIAGSTINLSNSITKYTYNVDSNVNTVVIKATPENDNYDVTIDGEDADYDDNYKRTVNLEKGQNIIKVEIEHNNKDRVYTLIINRGNVSSSNTNNGSTNTDTNTGSKDVKANQWVQTNGIWQYNDAEGKVVKNSWIQNYYLNSDGNMVTGWLNLNGTWYYFGTDGAKKVGWQQSSGKWYYLDSEGRMQTGWVKDRNGKYYYLNSDGSMAYNTKIGVYRLGADGAWIK